MTLIPLTSGAYSSQSVIANAQRCVNLYPESNPKATNPPVPVTHYQRPGLVRIGGVTPNAYEAGIEESAEMEDVVSAADELLAVHFPQNTVVLTEAIVAVDSAVFSFSFWMRSTQELNNFEVLVDKASVLDGLQNFEIGDGPEGGQIIVGDSDLGAGIQGRNLFETTDDPIDTTEWTSIVGTVKTDLSAGNKIVKLYVNRVDVTAGVSDTFSAFTITADGFPVILGNTDSWEGDIAEFWFAMDQSLLTGSDISATTLDKFVTVGLQAVQLGDNGELPTGTSPTIYMRGGAATFPTNLGTGGDTFTVSGDPLTDATTTPY